MEKYKTLRFSVEQLTEEKVDDDQGHQKIYCLLGKSMRGIYAISTTTISTTICYYNEKEFNSPHLKEFVMEDATNYIAKNYLRHAIIHLDCSSPMDLVILFKFEE